MGWRVLLRVLAEKMNWRGDKAACGRPCHRLAARTGRRFGEFGGKVAGLHR